MATSFMAFVYSPNAMALDRGTCLPFNQMVAAIEAEGQFDIINVDYNVPFLKMAMYTTNDKMNRGYEITGMRPDQGSKPAKLCIDNVLYDIRFRNAWEATLPSSYFLKKAGEASKIGDLQSTLEYASTQNKFPTLQGRISGPGNETLTVVAGIKYRTGAQFITPTNGTVINLANYRNFAYTPEGARILRGQIAATPSIPGYPTNTNLSEAIASAYVSAGFYIPTNQPTVIRRLRKDGTPLSDTRIVVSDNDCTPNSAGSFYCRFTYRFNEDHLPPDPKIILSGFNEWSEDIGRNRVRQTGKNETGSGNFKLVAGKWTSNEFVQLARNEAVQERQKRLARQRTLEQRAANQRAAEIAAAEARRQQAVRDRAAQAQRAQAPAPRPSGRNCRTVTAVIGKNRTWVPGPPEFGGGYWDEDDIYGPKYVCD